MAADGKKQSVHPHKRLWLPGRQRPWRMTETGAHEPALDYLHFIRFIKGDFLLSHDICYLEKGENGGCFPKLHQKHCIKMYCRKPGTLGLYPERHNIGASIFNAASTFNTAFKQEDFCDACKALPCLTRTGQSLGRKFTL